MNSAKLIRLSLSGSRLILSAAVFLMLGLMATQRGTAQTTNLWNATNGVSTDIVWADPTNWINAVTGAPLGVPGTAGNVSFFNNGGTLTFPTPPATGSPVGSVLSTLGGGIAAFTTNNLTCILTNNQTIHSLFICPTNTVGGMQNLYIPAGVMLAVQGTNDNGMGLLGDYDNAASPNGTPSGGSLTNESDTMYVGRQGGTGNSALENDPTEVAIAGGGTLFLNNTNNQMQVRDCNSAGGTHPATLDMSALANFQANLARVKFGVGEQNFTDLRGACIVYLAMTNTFVLGGTNSGELDNFVEGINPENAGNPSQLYWGWTNGVYADTVLFGGRKSGGVTNRFNPNFANPSYLNTQPTPTATFRNSKGGPVNLFRVGDEFDGDAGTVATAVMDMSGGIVDISASTMILGRGQNQGGGAEILYLFKLGDGVLNVNNLQTCSQGIAPVSDPLFVTNCFVGTKITVTNSLQLVVPFSRLLLRELTLILGNDANNVPATLTTLGTVTTGYITESQPRDSIVNYVMTNSFIDMVNPQPLEASSLVLNGGAISNASYVLVTGYGGTNNAGAPANNVINNTYGNSMTILNNGQFLGNPIFDLGVRIANWDISGIGGSVPGSLVVSNTLEGIGTIDGSVVQAPGATIQAGEGTAAGTLAIVTGVISNTVPGNLTLNQGGNLQFGLSSSGTSGNDSISVQGTLTLNGTNSVNLTSLGGSFDTIHPYTLITSGSALPVNAANYFKASGALGGSRYILTFDTTTAPNNLQLDVSGSGPSSDTWKGTLNGNAWDVKTTANWNGDTSQFFDLDTVTFDDTGSATPAINTSGSTLIPGSITISTTNNNYTFGGTGSIQDGGMFTANGVGSITFTNSGGVAFQDTLTIASNAVTLGGTGQYSFNGDVGTQIGLNLNGGSLTLAGNTTATFLNPVFSQILNVNAGSINVSNANVNVFNGSTINLVNANSFFVVGQPSNVSALCDGVFSGSGQIIQNGPGLLSLSGANGSLSGQTVVNGGTLQTQVGSAAGSTGVTVNSGGTLDVFGNNLAVPTVTASGFGVGGTGAVVSSSGTGGIIAGLTLLANTSVGGAPAWTFDPVQNRGLFVMNGTLSASVVTLTTTNAFNFLKVGGNEVQFNFGTVDPFLANIDVQGGMLYLTGSGGLGNPANTITVESGAVIGLANYSSAPTVSGNPTKSWILNGDGTDPTLLDYGISQSTINGPVTLNGFCIVSAAPNARINNGGSGTPGNVEIEGPISGTGSLNMQGDDIWMLAGTNTYGGNTTVTSGTLELTGSGCISNSPVISIQNGAELDASERSDQNLDLGSGQTLTTLNGGTVNGNLVTVPGSTVEPGGATSLDVLTVQNINGPAGNVILGGTTAIKLEPSLNGSPVDSDQLDATNGGQTITYGGTLQLSNFGGTYAIGQSFQIFNGAAYAGVFTNITPAQPGSGLAWNTNQLVTNGIITIVSGPITDLPAKIVNASLSGSTITLSGSGGADNGTYYLLTSTNITQPLSTWTSVSTNSFSGTGTFSVNASFSSSDKARFYAIESH